MTGTRTDPAPPSAGEADSAQLVRRASADLVHQAKGELVRQPKGELTRYEVGELVRRIEVLEGEVAELRARLGAMAAQGTQSST